MNTLLLLAGIFGIILIALIIESRKTLKKFQNQIDLEYDKKQKENDEVLNKFIDEYIKIKRQQKEKDHE